MCILMSMSKSKRLQIPVSEADEALVKMAARKSGLATAEWARRLLLEKAQERLSGDGQSPTEILKQLCTLNAPVSKVKKMKEESIKGRLR